MPHIEVKNRFVRLLIIYVAGSLTGSTIGCISYFLAFNGTIKSVDVQLWLLKEGAMWGFLFGTMMSWCTLWPLIFLEVSLVNAWIILTSGTLIGMYCLPVEPIGVTGGLANQPSLIGGLVIYILTYLSYLIVVLGRRSRGLISPPVSP